MINLLTSDICYSPGLLSKDILMIIAGTFMWITTSI